MKDTAPTQDQAMCFYRAALSTARLIDRENEHRVLDADADAAWRAYGGDLPPVVRCDLVLRNLAMLYPAAFAPGPVFSLSGWYDDDPWGAGFERPPARMVEGLFATRATPANAAEALDHALAAWGLLGSAGADGSGEAVHPRLARGLSPSTNVVVAGSRAMAHVARAFLRGQRLSARTQVILVTDRPEARHALGIVCALLGEAGAPLLVSTRRGPDEPLARWAEREKQRLKVAQARLLVTSSDADPSEDEAARAIAAALGADEAIDLAGS
ncbi:hypothetical protein [Sorangium sp. So ce394]|uniref:hypothetical protein n=1 Tax=Sorangium sp. So ce394 TaxID=3133310 RepID=UPI003F5B9962